MGMEQLTSAAAGMGLGAIAAYAGFPEFAPMANMAGAALGGAAYNAYMGGGD